MIKTYSNYIITRPWLNYNIRYDYNKVIGEDVNYGNPLDSPIVTDLIYSIDILSNRIRKTNDKYSKARYIDVVFEMEGDLNFYLRSPRQRYLDDLAYLDREPKKWKLLKNKFSYCISDLENLTRNATKVYITVMERLREDFTSPIDELPEQELDELCNLGYLVRFEIDSVLINPELVKNGMKYRYIAEALWKERVTKEAMQNLNKAKNLRVYGMEDVPKIPEQQDDYIQVDLLQ